MFVEKQRIEPAFFNRLGKLDRRHRVIGGKSRDSESRHRLSPSRVSLHAREAAIVVSLTRLG